MNSIRNYINIIENSFHSPEKDVELFKRKVFKKFANRMKNYSFEYRIINKRYGRHDLDTSIYPQLEILVKIQPSADWEWETELLSNEPNYSSMIDEIENKSKIVFGERFIDIQAYPHMIYLWVFI